MSSSTSRARSAVASRTASPSPMQTGDGELSPYSKRRAEALGAMNNSEADAAMNSVRMDNEKPGMSEEDSEVPHRIVNRRGPFGEDSSESDDDSPRLPVGRMAARLLATEDDSPEQTTNGDSYARVKRLLLGRRAASPSEEAANNESAVEGQESTNSVDEASAEQGFQSSQRGHSPFSTRTASPDLFVPTSWPAEVASGQHSNAGQSDSDSDALPTTLVGNERFQALVAQKRAERLAREQAAKAKAAEAQRRAAEKISKEVEQLGKILSEEVDDEEDIRARKRLTQQSRPARKASKKALEEMSRETQRLSRNQQLTHQAMVKKRFSTQDLFKRFNYKQDSPAHDTLVPQTDDEYVMSGALVSSDTEGRKAKETPPSSPPSVTKAQTKAEQMTVEPDLQADGDLDENLPSLEEVLTQPIVRIDNGKLPLKTKEPSIAGSTKGGSDGRAKKHRIRSPLKHRHADDSEDDIEIVGKPRFSVFDKLPPKKTAESHSLLNLRALAHLTSPSKAAQKGRKSLTSAELQAQLQQQARKQALREKQERIAELRAKGIVIQTEEEKEKEQLEIENLLEKARQEAQELAKREKEAAKKEGQPVVEPFGDSDDEEDGEYVEGAEDELEEDDIAASGSEEDAANGDGEDEDDEEDEDESEDRGMDDMNPLIDDAAEDDEAEVDTQEDMIVSQEDSRSDRTEEDTQMDDIRVKKPHRRNVVEDDEDEDTPDAARTPSQAKTPQPAPSSAAAAFGFKTLQTAPLGLTQMFAGTMADLDSQNDPPQAFDIEQDSLALLRQIPMATLPEPENLATAESLNILVEDSQTKATTVSQEDSVPQPFDFGFSQFPSQPAGIMSPTKLSEIPDPTPDAGFDLSRTPALLTVAPHSTVDTVVLQAEDSPVAQRRGRLHRRIDASVVLTDEETVAGDADLGENNDFQLSTTAFDVLFKAAKKPPPADNFDKKKSNAKTMFEEQAEESEDEYAGLGGASDEDSDGEVDEEVQKMMDDSHVEINERKLAQLFADKERASDEKAIDKLYKDIATGALRRKRGANFDDLSEDEDDAAEERRRRKQLEFARMRKALLEDENIGKIAENPKKMAFLQAIEDRDEEDEMNFLGESEMHVDSVPDSQPTGEEIPQQDEIVEEDNAEPLEPPKESIESAPAMVNTSRTSHRRTAVDDSMSRPTTIAEIRESLSFLVEDTIIPDSQRVDSDSDEEEDGMDVDRPTKTRQVLGSVRASVVNRLSIVTRNDDEEKPDGPMAFHAPTSNSPSVFKVPSLLRRATNLSTASSSSSGTTTPTTETGVRMGGSKKSNIHYQAREAERRKIVEAAERKRKGEVKKSVIGKGRSSMLGALGRSTGFE